MKGCVGAHAACCDEVRRTGAHNGLRVPCGLYHVASVSVLSSGSCLPVCFPPLGTWHVSPWHAGKTTVISWAVKLFLEMPPSYAAAFAAAAAASSHTPSSADGSGYGYGSGSGSGGQRALSGGSASSKPGAKQAKAAQAAKGGQRKAPPEAMVCAARSNAAALNIAVALIKRGLGPQDFRWVYGDVSSTAN